MHGVPVFRTKRKDPAFLCSYKPDDFLYAHNDVHSGRTDRQAFLFRIDPRPDGNPVIVVQSAIKPDWDYAFHNAGFLLAGQRTVECDLSFSSGQNLRFWLEANPTKKVGTLSKTERKGGIVIKERDKNGRRVPLPSERLDEWIISKAEHAGFRVHQPLTITLGYAYFAKPEREPSRLRSARFEGILEVTDGEVFREAIIRGIGPAKGFGFGLVSVAPLKG
ncbi:MAG: type I-E CRISPR-associated protein Cas6/Cse3/CasE [Chloroflexi bacterium]|nr:type I-E CRISPR-associated protein Cas6/Cse3/CasE [Chloroflexota bacterium]